MFSKTNFILPNDISNSKFHIYDYDDNDWRKQGIRIKQYYLRRDWCYLVFVLR